MKKLFLVTALLIAVGLFALYSNKQTVIKSTNHHSSNESLSALEELRDTLINLRSEDNDIEK